MVFIERGSSRFYEMYAIFTNCATDPFRGLRECL